MIRIVTIFQSWRQASCAENNKLYFLSGLHGCSSCLFFRKSSVDRSRLFRGHAHQIPWKNLALVRILPKIQLIFDQSLARTSYEKRIKRPVSTVIQVTYISFLSTRQYLQVSIQHSNYKSNTAIWQARILIRSTLIDHGHRLRHTHKWLTQQIPTTINLFIQHLTLLSARLPARFRRHRMWSNIHNCSQILLSSHGLFWLFCSSLWKNIEAFQFESSSLLDLAAVKTTCIARNIVGNHREKFSSRVSSTAIVEQLADVTV